MSRHPIRFGIATGQQRYEWPQLRHLWEVAERAGYDSLWTGDHLYAIMADPSESTFEGWTTLAALSQHTSRVRIGSLVNCNGFRNPCLTAKMAVTLDHLSDGRFILGLGAGWFEQEHRSLGFEFEPTLKRLRALDEACRIIKAMLAEGRAIFHGRHYEIADAICSPKPIQRPRPPLMIAGRGENVLLKIVAEHADMWNTQGNPEQMKGLIEVIRRHGDRIRRDTDEIEKTVVITLCYRPSREQEEEAVKFTAMIGRTSAEQARKQMMIGDQQECLDKIELYRRAGITHFIFMLREPYVPDEVARYADEVFTSARRD
ncbi:MAG: TIGR03560 family F420-dependent LLM class oxidoreductase [Deltaproteobacteria bacterium]|nr:TIGR03560 family F420-dependent LLM class oxidoreductase [Deltaproteobacteria bacterium]